MSVIKFSQWQDLDGNEVANSSYPPGLVFIKSQSIGSGVSSVTVTGAFSSTFDDYKIMISGGVGSTNMDFRLQLGSTTTGYYTGVGYHPFATAGPSSVQAVGSYNVANFRYVGSASTTGMMANIDLNAPYLARQTVMTTNYGVTNPGGSVIFTNGFVNNTTQYTAFTILLTSGTITGGTIRVYGYNNG